MATITSKNVGFEGPWYVKRAKIVKSFFPTEFCPFACGGKRKNILAWNLLKNQFEMDGNGDFQPFPI